MKLLRQEGQALVEMALVLPLLLTLLLGTVEMGRIFHAYIVVTQASREGARAAAVGLSDAAIEEVIMKNTSSLGDAVEIIITPAENNRHRGDDATVEVDSQVDLVAPVVTAILPDPFLVKAATSMRVE